MTTSKVFTEDKTEANKKNVDSNLYFYNYFCLLMDDDCKNPTHNSEDFSSIDSKNKNVVKTLPKQIKKEDISEQLKITRSNDHLPFKAVNNKNENTKQNQKSNMKTFPAMDTSHSDNFLSFNKENILDVSQNEIDELELYNKYKSLTYEEAMREKKNIELVKNNNTIEQYKNVFKSISSNNKLNCNNKTDIDEANIVFEKNSFDLNFETNTIDDKTSNVGITNKILNGKDKNTTDFNYNSRKYSIFKHESVGSNKIEFLKKIRTVKIYPFIQKFKLLFALPTNQKKTQIKVECDNDVKSIKSNIEKETSEFENEVIENQNTDNKTEFVLLSNEHEFLRNLIYNDDTRSYKNTDICDLKQNSIDSYIKKIEQPLTKKSPIDISIFQDNDLISKKNTKKDHENTSKLNLEKKEKFSGNTIKFNKFANMVIYNTNLPTSSNGEVGSFKTKNENLISYLNSFSSNSTVHSNNSNEKNYGKKSYRYTKHSNKIKLTKKKSIGKSTLLFIKRNFSLSKKKINLNKNKVVKCRRSSSIFDKINLLNSRCCNKSTPKNSILKNKINLNYEIENINSIKDNSINFEIFLNNFEQLEFEKCLNEGELYELRMNQLKNYYAGLQLNNN